MSMIDSQDLDRLRQELMGEIAAIRRERNSASDNNSVTGMAEAKHFTDRRGMMKRMAGLALGVAAVGVLQPKTIRAEARGFARNNPLATGGNMIIGATNSPTDAADVTSLVNPPSALSQNLLVVDNFTPGQAFREPDNSIAAIVGHVDDTGAASTGEDLYGIYGQANGGASCTGVYGFGGSFPVPTGTGVQGVGKIGVSGISYSNSSGCEGHSFGGTAGSGVVGYSNSGLGGTFQGARAALSLSLLVGVNSAPNPNVTPPSGAAEGDVYRGPQGGLWFHSGGENPYRKISGIDSAGAVHIIATSYRFVDTRNGTGGSTGPFGNGEVRSYNFVTDPARLIPQGARGVFGNVTAVSPGGNGNFQVNIMASFAAVNSSVINFVPSVNLSNHFVAPIDSTGRLFVKANVLTGSGTVHLLIDIQGYFI